MQEINKLLREKGLNVRLGIRPVAGMQVWKAKTSIVMKRSMASGYAGLAIRGEPTSGRRGRSKNQGSSIIGSQP